MNFRTKLFGLAGAVMAFSGMAYGQLACTGAGSSIAAPANFIRAEGQTELLPTITLTCTASAAVVAGSTANITLYFSPAVAVTSAIVTAATGATESIATASTGAFVSGIVSGSSITYSGIPITAATAGFTISNIRVNATAIPTTVGQAPTAVSAQAFVSGANVTPGPTASIPVSYALNGLVPSKEYAGASTANAGKVSGIPGAPASSFGVCGAINSGGTAAPNFYVSVNEGFQNAFKTLVDETGIGLDAPASGTRIAINFTNIPAGMSIYLPTSVTGTVPASGATPVLTAIASAATGGNGTAGINAVTAATSPSQITAEIAAEAAAFVVGPAVGTVSQALGAYLVPQSNGSATAWYEVTTDNLASLDNYYIPVTLVAGTNSLPIQSSALTVSTSFAPVTAATTIPSFAVGSSTAPVSFLSFTSCTTTLLFPFVTNTSGFDTGIAIANTTADPFGTKAQSGTCKLNWYGSGTVVAGNATDVSGNSTIAAGTTLAFDLPTELALNAANPATFQGYIIAQCGFQNAHGFAYITYGFPGTSSDTMGYLGLVLARGTTALEGNQF